MDLIYNKSENFNNNYNIINKVNNEISQIDLNYIKNKSYYDYCNLSNNVKSKQILLSKNQQSNYFNLIYFKSKCYGNNIVNNNYNISNKFSNIDL